MGTVTPNEFLRRMPVFGGLNDATLDFILEKSVMVNVEAGDYFFRQGDSAGEFYVLSTGVVVVERDWHGQPVELNRFGVGECFGEMAIVDLESRSASVRAIETCEARKITRRSLAELYKFDVEQYAIIMMNMGREISRRLRLADERLFAFDQSETNHSSNN